MVDAKLVEYISNGIAQGYNVEQIKQHLINNRISLKDVEEAIGEVNKNKGLPNINNALVQKQVLGYANKNIKQAYDIKKRNVFLVFLFSFITFGLYSIYWLVSTTHELQKVSGSAPKAKLLLFSLLPLIILAIMFSYLGSIGLDVANPSNIEGNPLQDNTLFIIIISALLISIIISTIAGFIYMYKYSKALNELSGFSMIGLMVIWILIWPIAQIIIQIQLNKHSGPIL